MQRRPLAGRSPLAHLPCTSTSRQRGQKEPILPSEKLAGQRRSALTGTAEKIPFLAGGRTPASKHAEPSAAPAPPTRQPETPAEGRGVPSDTATRVPASTASLQRTYKFALLAEPAATPVPAGSSRRSEVPKRQLQKLQSATIVASRLSGKATAASSCATQSKIPRPALNKLGTYAPSAPTHAASSGAGNSKIPRPASKLATTPSSAPMRGSSYAVPSRQSGKAPTVSTCLAPSKIPRPTLNMLGKPASAPAHSTSSAIPSRPSGKAPATPSWAGESKIPRPTLKKLETPAPSAPTHGSSSASVRAPRYAL